MFTRTPDGPYSAAQDLVSEWIAVLVALYSADPAIPTRPLIEPTLTTAPPPRAAMPGAISPVSKMTDFTFTASAPSISSSLISAVGPGRDEHGGVVDQDVERPAGRGLGGVRQLASGRDAARQVGADEGGRTAALGDLRDDLLALGRVTTADDDERALVGQRAGDARPDSVG